MALHRAIVLYCDNQAAHPRKRLPPTWEGGEDDWPPTDYKGVGWAVYDPSGQEGEPPRDLAEESENYLTFEEALDFDGLTALCPECREHWTIDDRGEIIPKD